MYSCTAVQGAQCFGSSVLLQSIDTPQTVDMTHVPTGEWTNNCCIPGSGQNSTLQSEQLNNREEVLAPAKTAHCNLINWTTGKKGRLWLNWPPAWYQCSAGRRNFLDWTLLHKAPIIKIRLSGVKKPTLSWDSSSWEAGVLTVSSLHLYSLFCCLTFLLLSHPTFVLTENIPNLEYYPQLGISNPHLVIIYPIGDFWVSRVKQSQITNPQSPIG